jgi:ABC-type uncharacterized transport system substrate-binding protein
METSMSEIFADRARVFWTDNRKPEICGAFDKLLRPRACRGELLRGIRNLRFGFIVSVISAMLFGLCSSAAAQQPKKIPRIGYLSSQDPASESIRSEPIRAALRDLGYIEGQNIAIEYRYSEGKRDRAPELLSELVRLKVDIIVVSGGTPWVQAAKNATKTIPIVMTGAGLDPVEAGFIDSLARPGGNVTGVTPWLRTRREAAGAAQRGRS